MEKWQDPNVIILWIVITLILLVVLILFISYLIKISYKKDIEKRELVFNEKLKSEREMKKAIITTQENERKVIASELHDQISNKLNLVVLKLNALDANSFNNEIAVIKDDIKTLIKKNRDITHYLFPVEIDNLGLFLCIKELCYSSKDFSIDLYAEENIDFGTKLVEHQLYRVIQEFITNSIKYSGGNQINIHIKKIKDNVTILLSDNGVGIDLDNINKGLGINNTETRLSAINAIFKYKSSKNKGTRLIIKLCPGK
ncbi:sensor histidine kinase [Faecalibacter bovis]|uniref:histidine kinase n=1 Tax=Faecalibacter bovis TaxID=2898187 RepID=A0ABX7XBA6_9FLAO|nr:ATP-binding protein [Faecalibacter bovis]QTV05168.1 histidine kinase [Faecalibacter bovis]